MGWGWNSLSLGPLCAVTLCVKDHLRSQWIGGLGQTGTCSLRGPINGGLWELPSGRKLAFWLASEAEGEGTLGFAPGPINCLPGELFTNLLVCSMQSQSASGTNFMSYVDFKLPRKTT